ncbi:tumor necrosis factor ligand superfamily member 6 [Synchiropus splendidus]|uniref:tumor necrosis factor ligand superfamily member 6 n=1 Tax=Synchiropus splendidus TaxID=270530 RepID=UPI00237DED11|nr:tumor necrosis factor ligand superfamily member 6 [Synchiropus splendidus]
MMNQNQNYPHPGVFVVDAGGGQQPLNQYPYHGPSWSFPPAQEVMRKKRKSYSFMGVSSGLVMVVLLLFLLVFVAMGYGTYKIFKMQEQLSRMAQVNHAKEFRVAEKQIGFRNNTAEKEKKASRAAAHVIGRIETKVFHKTLRWDPRIGRAFVTEGVTYQGKEGALQINEAGLYHIYCRVELTVPHCTSTFSFIHSVLVKRVGQSSPLTLMEAHEVGFCPSRLKESWTKESYLASAVLLQQDDKVFVNVSHPRDVRHSEHANFFGLYKV